MCAIMSGLVSKFAYSKLSRMLAPLVYSGIYYDISNISVSCFDIFYMSHSVEFGSVRSILGAEHSI